MGLGKIKSLWGRKVWTSTDDHLVGASGTAAGVPGGPSVVHGQAPGWVGLFDDFLGDVVADEWNLVEGDTGHSQAIQVGTNGVLRLTSSATATATPAGGQGVTSQLNWKANQGPGAESGSLRMTARVKAGTYTMGGLFIGFTDNNAFEMPAYDTGGALFTQAADCVGFLFGENGDTGWMGVSAKSTAGDSGDQSVALTTTAPTANTYQTFEVEILRGNSDTGGSAFLSIDGARLGRINSPVASTTALTPVVAVFDVNDTGAPVIDIDYINVSAPRDTGT